MGACLKQHSLAPKGCPFALTKQSDQKIVTSSIRLDAQRQSVVQPEATAGLPESGDRSGLGVDESFSFTAKGTQSGRAGTVQAEGATSTSR